MATYILMSTLTGAGSQTLHGNPDRMTEVNKEIEAFGCEVLSQYATLGAYDFVTIIEAQDNETVAHLSVDLASRGTVKIMTLPAMPVQRLIDKMKMPHKMGKA
ncbi:MAG: GYD domain-containing protein [Alphaproteobacteria bacterium]|nr:GYD domain-containing protein [Alphaproteobacteria bacterium]MCZ6609185.1 GYD domain-containing protein [Alphaproteobacteria bacterium]